MTESSVTIMSSSLIKYSLRHLSFCSRLNNIPWDAHAMFSLYMYMLFDIGLFPPWPILNNTNMSTGVYMITCVPDFNSFQQINKSTDVGWGI